MYNSKNIQHLTELLFACSQGKLSLDDAYNQYTKETNQPMDKITFSNLVKEIYN